MKKAYQWIKARLNEKSTWDGSVYVIMGALAVYLIWRSPQYATSIGDAVMAIALAIIYRGGRKVAEKEPPCQ